MALPSGVVDLESLFKNLAASVAGMTVLPGETLKDLDARHYRAESFRTDLAEIERKISKETQLDRKYALAKEKQRIQRELLVVSG